MIPELPFDGVTLPQAPACYESSPWSWWAQTQDVYLLVVGLKGCVSFSVNGERRELAPWQAHLFPPHCVFEGKGEYLQNFSLRFKPKNLISPLGELSCQISDIKSMRQAIDEVLDHSLDDTPFGSQALRLNAMRLVMLFWKEQHLRDLSEVDRKILGIVDRLSGGKDLFRSGQQLADEVGVSRMHLSQRFAVLSGKNLNRFQIEKRLERACLLLQNTRWSMTDVASSIGYETAPFFVRQFKKEMGLTPGQYRSEVKEQLLRESKKM